MQMGEREGKKITWDLEEKTCMLFNVRQRGTTQQMWNMFCGQRSCFLFFVMAINAAIIPTEGPTLS